MLTQHLFMQEKFVVQTFTFLCTRLPSFVQDKIRKTFREQSWRKIGMLSISQFTFKDYKYKTYNNFKDYYFKPRHSSTFNITKIQPWCSLCGFSEGVFNISTNHLVSINHTTTRKSLSTSGWAFLPV